jgi:hypothetical protein
MMRYRQAKTIPNSASFPFVPRADEWSGLSIRCCPPSAMAPLGSNMHRLFEGLAYLELLTSMLIFGLGLLMVASVVGRVRQEHTVRNNVQRT